MIISTNYDAILIEARKAFIDECTEFDLAWRILRVNTVMDGLYGRMGKIKIMALQKRNADAKVELIGVINYAVIGLIQLKNSPVTAKPDLDLEKSLELYNYNMKRARNSIIGADRVGQKVSIMGLETWADLITRTIEETRSNIKLLGESWKSEKSLLLIINYAIFALENIDVET